MSNCIKIVDAMPQADQDALLARVDNYRAVGMTPKQAQLEAAKEALKRLEGEMPVVQQSARSPLGFYSALAEGIAAMPTKQAMAGAWMSQIKGLVNKGAVKADEIEWSGLEDWLKLQEGKVSKEQITEFLDANGVQVQETVLGEPEKSFDIYREERGGRRGAHQVSYGTEEDAQAWIDDRDPDEGEFMIEEQDDADNPTGTKYDQYTLPGGKNYREILLTLPESKPTVAKYAKLKGITEAQAIADRAGLKAWQAENKGNDYQSAHWDKANVVAHLRVNDRVDAGGARVLFVEELQSDFQQDYRKSKEAIGKAVESDFEKIVERMKKAGVLEVECD
jgi:hypothetical protein